MRKTWMDSTHWYKWQRSAFILWGFYRLTCHHFLWEAFFKTWVHAPAVLFSFCSSWSRWRKNFSRPPQGLGSLGCVHTKSNTATKTQCFPFIFIGDPLWYSCRQCVHWQLSPQTCPRPKIEPGSPVWSLQWPIMPVGNVTQRTAGLGCYVNVLLC